MHVVFIEPRFPTNQRYFVRALKEVGATVTAIGEGSKDSLSGELKEWLTHYEQVDSVVNEGAVLGAGQFINSRHRIDRLEATVEAHIMSTAHVGEAMGIPGTSVQTAFLCRDKPSMKAMLRKGGIPCAQSTAASSVAEIVDFAKEVGFPLIIKPRDGAGASGTSRVTNLDELHRAARELGVDGGRSVAVEEFIEGHEGFYDTITMGGRVVHDFATHYYPNVLEAMRTRWISPQFVVTNRIDSAEGYAELKRMGEKVVQLMGLDTSATHMEWVAGMALQVDGVPVALEAQALRAAYPKAGKQLCLFIHGLSCDEHSWFPGEKAGASERDFGLALQRELGYTPLYLRYNTGRPIADNGAKLAVFIEELLAVWPKPLKELVIIGHSMGGLISLAASELAVAERMRWPAQTRMLICLGSPNLGSPVEMLGHLANTALNLSKITEPLGKIAAARSQGIKDLRHGPGSPRSSGGEHGMAFRFLGGSLSEDLDHPFSEFFGDGLVTPGSATTHEMEGDLQSATVANISHMALLTDVRVYEQIKAWPSAQ